MIAQGRLTRATIAGLAVLLGLFAASRDAVSPPPEEYFPLLAAVIADLRAGEVQLAREHPEPPRDAPLDARVSTLAESLEAYGALRDGIATRLEALDPPLNLKRTHDLLAGAARDLADGQAEAIHNLQQVTDLREVGEAYRHLYTPTLTFNRACTTLQHEATARSIAVNLPC